MLAAERKSLILEKLQEEKRVVVSELSKQFGVSEETIRRDLEKLQKDGVAVKSYGGAVLNENINIDMPFIVRRKKNITGKKIIAEIMVNLIEEDDHIFFDASTTALSIINELHNKKNRLTIVTNSIEIMLESADESQWKVISTGGQQHGKYLALVGPYVLQGINTMNADKVILSCKGFDMEKGITDTNELFAAVKQSMIQHAKTKILAADYSKFDKVAFSKICDAADIDIVVTDKKPSEEWLRYLDGKGIRCLYGKNSENNSLCK